MIRNRHTHTPIHEQPHASEIYKNVASVSAPRMVEIVICQFIPIGASQTKPVLGSGVICVFGLKKGILREETKEITHPPETVVSDGVKN